MAITISGTTVTFNDASTQTKNVPNSTADLSAGGVGTYAFLNYPGNNAARSAGFTIAGSSLNYAGETSTTLLGSGSPSGSWRLMGAFTTFSTPKGTGYTTASVWLRYA
jgi:hypothetical protein